MFGHLSINAENATHRPHYDLQNCVTILHTSPCGYGYYLRIRCLHPWCMLVGLDHLDHQPWTNRISPVNRANYLSHIYDTVPLHQT